MAAVDYFLKLDGIEGESKDHKHASEIEIESWSWGANNSGTFGHGTGGGAGKVSFQDFHFTMKVNKASPKLMLACAGGDHIKKGILTARKAGKDQQEFYKITIHELLVSNYQAGGSGAGDIVPIDQISLNFTKFEFEYKPQKADGTLDAAITAGWDLKANKKA